MDQDSIKAWAEKVAADLIVGGERVPFDRVLSTHMTTVNELRGQGLTWRSITNFLTRAGVHRKDNTPISPDQLRADVSRISRRNLQVPKGAQTASLARVSEITEVIATAPANVPSSISAKLDLSVTPAQSTKMIQKTDIAAALLRLKK